MVIYLATLPKSNSAYLAIASAMSDLENKNMGDIPDHLKDTHYSGAESLGAFGYKYPHDYENNYVNQQYMPENLKNTKYYFTQKNKYEESINRYWKEVK